MISKNLIEMVRNCMKKDTINLELVHTALLQALQISTVQGVEVCRLYDATVDTLGIGIIVQRPDSSVGAYQGWSSRCMSAYLPWQRKRQKSNDQINP